MSKDTPTPAPAPMTAERLYEVREQYRSGRWGDGLPRELFGHIDALTARVAELEARRVFTEQLSDAFKAEVAKVATLESELAAACKDARRDALEEAALVAEGWSTATNYFPTNLSLNNVASYVADRDLKIGAAIRALQTKDTTE